MLYKKIFFITLFIVVIFLFGAAAWVASYLSRSDDAAPSEYTAVYLLSGDIYYGKLRRFPALHLEDVWYLQRGGAEGTLSLQRFEEVFWKPTDKLYLNSDQVMWRAFLRNGSPLVKAFRNPSAFHGSAPPQVSKEQSAVPIIEEVTDEKQKTSN